MVASITDKFMKTGSRDARTTLESPGKGTSDTSITLTNPGGWETDTGITLSLYTEDPSTHKEIDGTYTVWKGVVSGSQVIDLQLLYGNNQPYAAGAKAVMHISSAWADSLIDGILAHSNQDGSLKTSAVQAALNTQTTSSPDWTVLATAPTLTSSNGQREYNMRFPGVDYTDRLSEGMKLKGARTTAAQTQSTGLNGTNQCWIKTSPTGMTSTDDIAAGAWVYLTSYADAMIISRLNATTGWQMFIKSNGQVQMSAFNSSLSNYSLVVSYQSIPLNKWVHVVAQIDMSAFTTTLTTSYIMIDGQNVACSVARAGTNPTSLVQGGNLEVGSNNGGALPFPGKIQNAFVTSAKLTQAQVRAFKDQKLTTALATTYNMVSAFPFDGNGNDVNTTNANNLTANNGATATDTSTAFSTNLWGVITSISYTGGNTNTTVFCPSGAGIPNETLGSFSYSSVESPYGFPTDKTRWCIENIYKYNISHSNPTSGATIQNLLGGMIGLTLPTGIWEPGGDISLYNYRASAGASSIYTGWSTTNGSVTNPLGTAYNYTSISASGDFVGQHTPAYRDTTLRLSTMTDYYHYLYGDNGMTSIGVRGDWPNTAGAIWRFTCGYI